MDPNSRGVQIGIYSIALVGLALVIRKVRPFTQFINPTDIPNSFIKTRTQLKGKVLRIEPIGPFLIFKHQPLISIFPNRSSDVGLPVKIAGVNVTGNGISWLQNIVVNNNITCIAISKLPHSLNCEVIMNYPSSPSSHNPKSKNRSINIGEHLVALGFGTVSILDSNLKSNKYFMDYYNRLLKAEKRAEKRRMGVWLSNKSSPPWHSRLIAELWNQAKNNFPSAQFKSLKMF